jgi:transposase InsO family protein
MMLDQNVVAASPASVYRVLRRAGRLDRWTKKTLSKGRGFNQPDAPHRHWHIDVSYCNLDSTFYYLIPVLDGCSRFLLHHELRESMREVDIELVLQRARERYPEARPRVISDNGSAFIAKDFKQFIKLTGMTHVRTSPYYPQSNGKIERWHGAAKREALRRHQPSCLEEARDVLEQWIYHYNHVRLHAALGYVTPADVLAGRQQQIWQDRDRKLQLARAQRAARRRLTSTDPPLRNAIHP